MGSFISLDDDHKEVYKALMPKLSGTPLMKLLSVTKNLM
jgi:hypothetical protein